MAQFDSVRKKPKDTKGTFLRMMSYLGQYRNVIFGVFLLCFASNVLSLLGPGLAGKAINEAAAGKGQVNFDKVTYYVIRMLFCFLGSSILTVLINIIMVYVSKWISRKMRKDIFEKLMRLPVGFFDTHQAGDIISRVSYDVDVIGTCLATDVVQILTSIVTVAGSFVMMMVISPMLSLTVFVTIPLAVIYSTRIRKVTQPRFSKRSRNYGKMNGFVEEMLSGQKTILAYAYEDQVEEKFEKINTEVADSYYDAEYYGCAMGPTVNVINNLSLCMVAVFGALLYMPGLISLGQISSFVLYSRKFSGPINEIANIVNELYSALSAAERVFLLLDEEEELPDAGNAAVLSEVKGNVAFEHVSFGYEEGKRIIHDLSLNVDGGKLVAIVGPTGAGKTTIINLLMRFYDVNDGMILVDEKDIRNYTRESLRGAYAMVLQDTWVFCGTIFENIAYGRENATMEAEREIQKAMRELMKDKTCFVIAHRLSTIQHADRILVLNHGDVVEQGDHESLMDKKGFYYKLYAAQFE